MVQAEDRAHRIGGLHREVNMHYLHAANTVDDIVWGIVEQKLSEFVIGICVVLHVLCAKVVF